MNLKSQIKLLALLALPYCMLAQQPSWNVDDISHLAFKYHDGMYEQEYSHWTPNNVSFWTDNTYEAGSYLNPTGLALFDSDQATDIDLSSIVLSQIVGGFQVDERVRLDYDGLRFINAGSWSALDAYIWGNGGQLDLYTGGNGNYIARLGSTSANSGRGILRLYGPDGSRSLSHIISTDNSGYSYYYGQNGSANVFMGNYSGDPTRGALFVADEFGTAQAGFYVNVLNQGIVWGDVKSFRMQHPRNDDQEIWYASLEGPEAGAYERGTAQLVDGEAFIKFSEHFKVVANAGTMTVQITPLHWDTYGIAVVSKGKDGFKVKELKGGEGNFSFDWVATCKRNGKESFQVVRSKTQSRRPENMIHDLENPRQNSNRNLEPRSARVITHSENCLAKNPKQ